MTKKTSCNKFLRFYRSLIFIFATILSAQSYAGFFEVSANGSYYKYNNGETRDEQNTTTVQRYGAGLAYNFLGNTSLEFKYTASKNTDRYTQETDDAIYRITRTTEFQNYGLNLVLEFADRKQPFRPFVTGGLGYMVRKSTTNGTIEDATLLNGQDNLSFNQDPETKSLSADAGIGFKITLADRLAFEGSFNVFATDLAAETIFLHYSAAGGLRFLF